jgi:hypothetical protein
LLLVVEEEALLLEAWVVLTLEHREQTGGAQRTNGFEVRWAQTRGTHGLEVSAPQTGLPVCPLGSGSQKRLPQRLSSRQPSCISRLSRMRFSALHWLL